MAALLNIDFEDVADAPDGYVVAIIRDVKVSHNTLRVSIKRFGFGTDYLSLNGWVDKETPLQPSRVADHADGLRVFIGPDVCRHLKPDMLVEIGLWGEGTGVLGRAKVLWPEHEAPEHEVPEQGGHGGWTDDLADLAATAPLTPSAAEVPPPAMPEPARVQVLATDRPKDDPKADRRHGIAFAAFTAVALAVGAAGAWYAFTGGPDEAPQALGTAEPLSAAAPQAAMPPQPAPAQPAPAPAEKREVVMHTREQVAAFLKTEPAPALAYQEAGRMFEAGTVDGAFLLYRYAADKGSAPAAVAIGRLYDPYFVDRIKQTFVRPSTETAASWYRKAADHGDAEGLALLGRLLLHGAPDLPADKAAARQLLKRAAEAGNADAHQFLATVD